MELPPHIRESLKDLGFTDYEISIYLTLVTHGSLNAKDLSKLSGVPYSRIYQILQLLGEKDFVIRDEEARPTIYSATPPMDALQSARDRYLDGINKKTKSLFDVLNPIYLMKSIPQRLEIFHIEGTEQCVLQIEKMIDRAEESVVVSTASLDILKQIYSNIEKVRFRGVSKIKILTQKGIFSGNSNNSELFEKYGQIASLREAHTIFGTLIITDEGKDAFIMYKKMLLGSNTLSGIFSENPLIGPLIREYFNQIYQNSKVLVEKEEKKKKSSFVST